MKKQIAFFVLTIFLLVAGGDFLTPRELARENQSGGGTPTQEKTETPMTHSGFTWRASLRLSYNDAAVKIGEENNQNENSLIYYYFGLGVEADISDYLTVGLVAGMNTAYFNDSADFVRLPLSLRFTEEKNTAMMIGLNARYRWDLSMSLSVVPRAGILYFKEFSREMPFQLPVVSGNATLKNSFTQFTLELLAQYDGLTNVTLFAGPQLNIISGDFKAEEKIGQLHGKQTLPYSQKRVLGLTAGVQFPVGNFFIEIWGSAFSKGSLTACAVYEF